MEQMVPELSFYQRHNIFNRREIEKIVDRRREFEGLLQTNKSLKSFLVYIEYEILLERAYNKRVRKLDGIQEEHIRSRINRLFSRATNIYPLEEKLLLTHLGYLVSVKDRDRACALALDLPRRLPGTPKIWIESGKALRESGQVHASRALHLRALRIHPGSDSIKNSFIQMETQHPTPDSPAVISAILSNGAC